MRKNTPALGLGICLAIVILISMCLPLWVVDYVEYTKTTSNSFNAFNIPSSVDHFNAEYQWICGFVGFLDFLLVVCMILAIVGGALVYAGKRGFAGMGVAAGTISMIVFFILMIIGFVAAGTYGGSYNIVAIGWGEFPFLITCSVAIPYMVMLFSRSYGKNSPRPSSNTSSQPSSSYSPSPANNGPRPADLDDGRIYRDLEGAQRVLDVYNDKVVLTQIQNFRAMVTHDFFKGDKVIPFISMTSIQFKEASSMILGYIQFEVPGVNSRDNFGSENSWTFYEKDNAIAKEVCEYCRQRIMDIKSPAPAPAPAPVPVAPAPSSNNFSVADEIRKLKQLLDEGIITQEEFDEQKRKLLNK